MQDSINFQRIRSAIEFIDRNYKSHPSLDEIARSVNMSSFHFQRLFTEWAGVSPKGFLQYISLESAKKILRETRTTLFDTAQEIGLSGTGRLHDLFVNIEGMTPAEYKNGGESLTINYSFQNSIFGKALLASTTKGLCYMAFADDEEATLGELKAIYYGAKYENTYDEIQCNAMKFFGNEEKPFVKIHTRGTPFQIKVWEALLRIPLGRLTTYGDLSQLIGNPKACRAVGSAVGDNPVSFIIPCHRVIRSTGVFGQYHWGSSRKTTIIGWEMAQGQPSED